MHGALNEGRRTRFIIPGSSFRVRCYGGIPRCGSPQGLQPKKSRENESAFFRHLRWRTQPEADNPGIATRMILHIPRRQGNTPKRIQPQSVLAGREYPFRFEANPVLRAVLPPCVFVHLINETGSKRRHSPVTCRSGDLDAKCLKTAQPFSEPACA